MGDGSEIIDQILSIHTYSSILDSQSSLFFIGNDFYLKFFLISVYTLVL